MMMMKKEMKNQMLSLNLMMITQVITSHLTMKNLRIQTKNQYLKLILRK